MGRAARIGLICGFLLLACAGASVPALSESYPDKPVSIIVPVGPGAAPDVIVRILADRLARHWKQQVVIVNRPGGGGMIGAQAAAIAPADGYMLYMPLSSAFTVLPESKTHGAKAAELFRELVPIGLIGDQPMVFAATPALGVATLPEFVALARRRPNEILYGAARGSVPHMTGELLNIRAGIKLGYVPTLGAAKVVQDIMNGNLHMIVDSMPGIAGALQSGAVKALAVASDKRLDNYPDVPLVTDVLPGFAARGWYALMAPAKTPAHIVHQLGADLRAVLADSELKTKFEVVGTFPRPSTVEQTTAYIRAEQDLWRPIVHQIGVE
jgi:tripartite-type tricarboxylate transporter receptor subunit TctC